jgi:putative membrane protein
MNTEIFSSLGNIGNFSAYMLESLILLSLFVYIYSKVTPYQEIELVRSGNISASISISGAIIGFSVALGGVISQSVNLIDLTVWGIVALIFQILAYLMIRFFIVNLTVGIPQGNIAHGLFSAGISIAVGILNASSMTP